MSNLLKNVCIKNFGPIKDFSCNKFSNINLIIGENGTGKSFLLKALYSLTKSMEEYLRGDDIEPISSILSSKIRWTFQVKTLKELVSYSSDKPLTLISTLDNEKIEYQITKEAIGNISKIEGIKENRKENSIFIPEKDVFSLYSVILKSRQIDHAFGFDDTYFDLVKALHCPLKKDSNDFSFGEARNVLSNIIDGKIDYNQESGKWYYENREHEILDIRILSDGIKKVAQLDRLLSNGFLTENSIVFIDEIENSLSPSVICTLLEVIDLLARKYNIQFFISSNSYFVIKKLQNIAINNPNFVKCISLSKDEEHICYDMKDAMIKNSIIDTSIKLYKEEIGKVL